MLVAPKQSEFGKFFWQDSSALAAPVRLSGSAWLNQRTVCRHSLKSAGKVLQKLRLQQQQQVIVGLDLGGRKQNLHFNVHMVCPPSNSPYVEPSKEIIMLLTGIIHAGQLCLL